MEEARFTGLHLAIGGINTAEIRFLKNSTTVSPNSLLSNGSIAPLTIPAPRKQESRHRKKAGYLRTSAARSLSGKEDHEDHIISVTCVLNKCPYILIVYTAEFLDTEILSIFGYISRSAGIFFYKVNSAASPA